jgi:hypothetical protein
MAGPVMAGPVIAGAAEDDETLLPLLAHPDMPATATATQPIAATVLI